MSSPLVQSDSFEEYMQTEHRPIRGGAPDGDTPPAEGADQGAAEAAASSGLYDLEEVDPEIREQLTPHLKAIEGNVTKKLQENADFRKGWEPYEEIGLRDIEPDEVKQLLEFAEMAQDPEKFGQWWKTVGQQLGLYKPPTQDQDLDDLGLDDLDLEGPSKEQIQELVEEQVKERISPIETALQQQAQQQVVEAAHDEIRSALEEVEGADAALFGGEAEEKEQVKEAIVRLAYPYSMSSEGRMSVKEMIQKGAEDYKNLIAKGEGRLFQQKKDPPDKPEGPGSAVATADDPTSFDDPRLKERALERLKQS